MPSPYLANFLKDCINILKKLIGERPYLQIRQYDSAIVHFIRFTTFLYRTITRNSLRNHSPTVDLHVLHKMDSTRLRPSVYEVLDRYML